MKGIVSDHILSYIIYIYIHIDKPKRKKIHLAGESTNTFSYVVVALGTGPINRWPYSKMSVVTSLGSLQIKGADVLDPRG